MAPVLALPLLSFSWPSPRPPRGVDSALQACGLTFSSHFQSPAWPCPGCPPQAAYEAGLEDLSAPPTKLPINLQAGGLAGGIDIFEGATPI